MSILDIASQYACAENIVERAQYATVDCHPVWMKLYRIKEYLRAQAATELAEVLK